MKSSIAIAAVLALCVCLMNARALYTPGFGDTDAAVHAMDGVFFLDFFKELPPPSQWKEYATNYYARYPALGLVAYPPLFGIALAPAFAVFGITVFAARMTVLLFAIGSALLLLALLNRRLTTGAAAFGALLMATSLEFVRGSREAMLEVPAIFFLIGSAAFWLFYVESRQRRYSVCAFLMAAAAVYTKQTAGFLAAVLISHALITDGFRPTLRNRSLWISFISFVVVLIPLGVLTLKFGQYGTAQLDPSRFGQSATELSYWTEWARKLGHVLNPFFLIVCAAGLPAVRNPRRRPLVIFAVLWILWWYVAFSAIPIKTHRFAAFVIPGFAILGGLAWQSLAQKSSRFVLAGVLVFLGIIAFREPFPAVDGYDKAARYVAAKGADKPVLFDGYHNANFVFHGRRFFGREGVILRGSKMITSTASGAQEAYPILESPDELIAMLKKYGVGYVVVEETPYLILAHSGWLRERLKSGGDFTLEQEIPIETNLPVYEAGRIRIYRYDNAPTAPSTDTLEIFVPSAGMTVRAPVLR